MLSFTTAVGNIFPRLGRLGKLIANMRSHQAVQLTAMTDTSVGVVAQFASESDIQALMGSAYQGILGSVESVGGLAQSIAQTTINRQVFRDQPQISQSLQSLNVLTSIYEVIRQMKLAGATVLTMTVTAAPSTFIGQGNGVIVASTKRPFDGLTLENAFSENVLFTCTQDSYTGGADAGNEGFQVTGVGNQSDLFAFNWPLGSNASSGLSAVDGNVDNGAGNLLTNSGFESWTSGVPDSFSLEVGTAGTNINQETGIVYDGTSALRITGDGSTLVRLTQAFDSSSGTSGSLSLQTQYSFNIFMRRDGTAAGNGTLTIDLADGNGNVINDNNGVANSFNINLTTLSTVYTSFTGVFRTPTIMPAAQYLRLRMPTGGALSNGRSVYADKGSMGIMNQLYTSGPFFNVHAGSIPFLSGDYAGCQITNSRGAGGTVNTWQSVLCTLLDPYVFSNEILFPSSSSPTVSDSLLN